jgi:predicted  nucleic acid-binding Zn-ribbon protein
MLEAALSDKETIDEQIRDAERELDALDAKRTALQDRIRQLWDLRQSIVGEHPETVIKIYGWCRRPDLPVI